MESRTRVRVLRPRVESGGRRWEGVEFGAVAKALKGDFLE